MSTSDSSISTSGISTCSASRRATCVRVDRPLLDEDLAESLARAALLREGERELFLGEQAVADQQGANSATADERLPSAGNIGSSRAPREPHG